MLMKKLVIRLLYWSYRIKRSRIRDFIRKRVAMLEGGQMYSPTLRRIFTDYHQIEIGLYSYGGCFDPYSMASFMKMGRYCSVAEGVRVFNANHPLEFKSMHPFFYNPAFEYVQEELIDRGRLTVGNDVWIGCNAIIMPSVKHVGDSAVIGAGAVVTKDVPDFAVVAGNPAKIIKYRFTEEARKQIKKSRWWEKDVNELVNNIEDFTCPYDVTEYS